MQSNANKIVVAVAGTMLAALVVIFASASGPAGGGGGGGGSSAPAESGETSSQGESSSPSSSGGSGWATGDYETDLERLKEELTGDSGAGINVRSAQSSQRVQSVAQTYDEVEGRNFEDVTIQVSFGMDGTYLSATEPDPRSADKYPSYRMSYLSAKNVMWQIVVNDGSVFAVPVASKDAQISREMLFTESDVIVRYDGASNTYSDLALDSLPNGTVGIHVDRIDSAYLDSLSVADLEAM